QIVPGGSIETTWATLRCGEFIVNADDKDVAIRLPDTALDQAYLTVTAERGCSLNPALRCLDNSVCVSASAGECSVGSGAITIAGRVIGRGAPAAYVRLRAAGDLRIDAPVTMNSTDWQGDAGDLRLESFLGSVTVNAKLNLAGRTQRGSYGYGVDGYPGSVKLSAAVDVTFLAPVDLSDGDFGGALESDAQRDIVIRADIALDSAPIELEADGGWLALTAGRDILIDVPQGGTGQTLISSNGGHALALYRHWDAGAGGHSELDAGGDIRIASGVAIEANSPFTYGGDGMPWGGYFKAWAGGDFVLDGTISLDGDGVSSYGGLARIHTSGDIELGQTSSLSARGSTGQYVDLRAGGYGYTTRKRIDVRGRVDVRTKLTTYYGETDYGSGGDFDMHAGDISVSGSVLAGDGAEGSSIAGKACTITLENSALIDQRSVRAGGSGGYNRFVAEEKMVAKAGSRIVGHPSVETYVSYPRANPPELEGTIDPPPVLDPFEITFNECSICGDTRRETGETCDDGNTAGGDGCSADCQDEGCILETPTYPTSPLCDDGDGCTADICNPTSHSCEHRTGCDDGVDCTVDLCESATCTHTADDSGCDDGNVCTSDLCNVTEDCVSTVTYRVACEDGDLCTLTGRCDYDGTCDASDLRAAFGGRFGVTNRSGTAGEDRWNAVARVPAAMITGVPTTTGLRVRIYEEGGPFVFDASIPAPEFSELRPGVYRFFDREGTVTEANGIRSVLMRQKDGETIVFKIEAAGADFADVYDSPLLGVSVLLGEDPAADDCATARSLLCKRTGARVRCRG
ncbi:MAG: hypothetical protein HY899_18330, partial [Deltaproteobacteria bacterium]|nr:hypothetical protein [Deltaproteobacteria bacterium]